MKQAILLGTLCLCCLAAPAGNAGQPTTKPMDKLVFPNHGFAISPLDQPAKGVNQVFFMFLPASGGFAPNVNVQTQTYEGTLDEYVALSLNHFKEAKIAIISSSKPDKDTAVFEYSGRMEERALHWYAKAVLKGGTAYLVTATATEDQWKEVSQKLKSCVDSFEMIPPQPKPE
ncbi:MAG TPA: hypothetical protein DCX07_14070 [Phycisphaerales bacterium]|nr:hypothetical protein [Phycisphaerales bacterium]